MKIDKDFKKALSELPDREKDKLVAMLLRRDPRLAKRLHYELLGDFSKEDLQSTFLENVTSAFEHIKRYHYKPGYLSMTLRQLSGEIGSYLFTTRDKHGEALMNLQLLNRTFEQFSTEINEYYQTKINRTFEQFSTEINEYYQTKKGQKLAIYLVNKAFNTRILIHKLDKDLYIDFRDDLETLCNHFANNHGIMDTSIYHGFDVNWLMNEELPKNIEAIRKDLRARGYLK